MIFLRKIIQSVYLKTLNVAVVLLSIANGV